MLGIRKDSSQVPETKTPRGRCVRKLFFLSKGNVSFFIHLFYFFIFFSVRRQDEVKKKVYQGQQIYNSPDEFAKCLSYLLYLEWSVGKSWYETKLSQWKKNSIMRIASDQSLRIYTCKNLIFICAASSERSCKRNSKKKSTSFRIFFWRVKN